jgi:hypothetical protein
MIPVTFPNKEGLTLFGIIHEPMENRYPDQAIIILSPGIKSRVAPHRLYVKMARKFSEIGFRVLRFDFYGLGDSEGEIEEKSTANLYGSIQVGRYIDDTIAALDWMQKKFSVNKFIISGLCGGAITGLHAAVKDSRIVNLIGLGIPVILDSSEIDHNQFITKGQLDGLRTSYIKKIFNLKAWIRFFSLKTDYRLMLKSIFRPLLARKEQRQEPLQTEQKDPAGNFNPHFPKILKDYASSRKIYLIFSETDRLFWEFQEKYLNNYPSDYESLKKNVSVEVIKEANHIFSFQKWQNEMLNLSVAWLRDQYKIPSPARAGSE